MKLDTSAIGITADFHVNFSARMKCGRCLACFNREFSATLYLTYIQGKDPDTDAEKVDLKTTDVERVYFTGSDIDLSTGIKEAIVLALPITSLCDSACKGLCPVCGINRNVEECRCEVKQSGLFTPIQAKQKPRRKSKKRRTK